MKLNIGENIIIYLSKPYIKSLDLKDRKTIEKLIKKINYKYNIDLYGFIDVKIYTDINYGVIITINKEELEYIDYFNNDIEMNIEVIEDSFLYKIDDIFKVRNLENYKVYKYKENIYLEANKISSIDLGILLENAEIIYGEDVKKIINKSKIIKPEVIL